MQILACPVCKGDLELKVDEEEGEEIVGVPFIALIATIPTPLWIRFPICYRRSSKLSSRAIRHACCGRFPNFYIHQLYRRAGKDGAGAHHI